MKLVVHMNEVFRLGEAKYRLMLGDIARGKEVGNVLRALGAHSLGIIEVNLTDMTAEEAAELEYKS